MWNLYKFNYGCAPFVFGLRRDYWPEINENQLNSFEKQFFFKNRLMLSQKSNEVAQEPLFDKIKHLISGFLNQERDMTRKMLEQSHKSSMKVSSRPSRMMDAASNQRRKNNKSNITPSQDLDRESEQEKDAKFVSFKKGETRILSQEALKSEADLASEVQSSRNENEKNKTAPLDSPKDI